MKAIGKFRITVALVSALAVVGMVAAALTSSAAAEPPSVWLCGNELVVAGHPCTVVSENLEALLLNDMSAVATVECPPGSVYSYGTVGPGAVDETTKVEFLETGKKCKPAAEAKNLNLENKAVKNECEKVESVEATGLPWKTEIMLEGGVIFDLINNEPGYTTVCKHIINITDKCISNEKGTAGNGPFIDLVNLTETETGGILLVSANFPEELLKASEAAHCSIGGAEAGLVIGENLLSAFLGGVLVSLEVSEE